MQMGEIGKPWTDAEIALTVESYFSMLREELLGRGFNKSAENKKLQASIGRSKGSIEFKHANISAVLESMNSFYIDGYKPRRNVQESLRREVIRRRLEETDLDALMLQKLDEPLPAAIDLLLHLEPAPDVEFEEKVFHRRAGRVNFVRLEADKRELGLAGELAVVGYETRRLELAGKPKLAAKIDHVSQSQGDGMGYDVLSFDENGRERFIEVKTTRRRKEWPFLVTRNELDFSQEAAGQFHLYRVFQFGQNRPGLYSLAGQLDATCRLEPTVYEGLPKHAVVGL
ncbi:DUF3883 domain-containing protein [Pseudarthrobacter sp. O4]|uniref:DUF3883 domain-containing protein n=1 Tax=Pseudarthrobacter sp. O4 TaxID=3418417 RepID=UPI003CFB5D09